METKVSGHIISCVQRPIDRRRRGCRGTPYFRRYDGVLVSKPAIWLKKSWGGYRSKTKATATVGIHNENHAKKKWPFSDAFGSRKPRHFHEPFRTKSSATLYSSGHASKGKRHARQGAYQKQTDGIFSVQNTPPNHTGVFGTASISSHRVVMPECSARTQHRFPTLEQVSLVRPHQKYPRYRFTPPHMTLE